MGGKSKLKFEQYKLEIQYISKVFHAIYRKFLTAIDHIDILSFNEYRTLLELKKVKNMICMDIIIPIPEP